MKKDLFLTIYDNDGHEVRTEEAQMIEIKFGTIRGLMKLLNIEKVTDTPELLGMMVEVWDELTKLLSYIFPNITDEEWDNVSLNELLPLVVDVIKSSFSKMLTIPTEKDGKN